MCGILLILMMKCNCSVVLLKVGGLLVSVMGCGELDDIGLCFL